MAMLKKVLPFLLVLLLAAAVAVYLFSRHSKVESSYENKAIAVVPDDAVWIIQSHSVPELVKVLIQTDPLFPSFQLIGALKLHLDAIRKIDNLVMRNPRLMQVFAKNPVVLSLHQTGKNQYQFLLILETQGASDVAGEKELFTQLCGKAGQWTQRSYNSQIINRITFGADALIPGISLAENKKYLVLSPSPILLENAVRRMTQEDIIYNGKTFSKLSGTTSKNAMANIFVNLKTFPNWLSEWMNPEVKHKMELFTRYGDWASLDITIRNDALWLNGFALEGDTLNSYLTLFKSQVPHKLEAEKYLPSTTAAFFTLGVENPVLYLKNLADYLGGGETGRKRQRIIDKANELSGENVVKVWADLGFRELTIGFLCGVADESVRPIALIEVKNGRQAVEKLLSKQKKAGGLPTRQQWSKKVFKVDDAHEYDIYPMPFEGLPDILGGSFFSAVTGKYFSFIGNVMVLANDSPTLEEALHKYTLGKTLANDAVYQSIAGLISTRSNATFFAFPFKAKPLLQSILNPKATSVALANDVFLSKIGAVGLQFNSISGMSLHNIFASFAEIDYTRPQTIWESRLDTKVLTQPTIVVNHITQDKEIIVQDVAFNLYLINSSGRILWRKNIGEAINSTIFQIDLMKNGKLQYLFSTRNAIHLMDRNGSLLPKYPIKLKLPATNGMALIDFDGNRDYRIMIACSDNKIYGFDKTGAPLKGWKFGPASGPITTPVQYFKIQNKDYLVFNDPVKVYILDRKGSVKVTPDKDFALSSNNRVVFEPVASGKGPRFFATDIKGTVYMIFLDGSVESAIFGEFGPDHYFDVEDVNEDGLGEFVFIDHNKLEFYRQTGEKLCSRKLSGNVTDPPGFYLFKSKMSKIGFPVASKKEIVVYNGDGTMYEAFPLYGSTLFTIGSLEKATSYQNLLVGSDDGYLYNYAIK